jgi:hypothetical protein
MKDIAMEARPPRSDIVLTPGQMRNRRRRNLAIGLAVGFMAALFYAITIVKIGPAAFRPLP